MSGQYSVLPVRQVCEQQQVKGSLQYLCVWRDLFSVAYLRKLTATCITAIGQEAYFQRTNRFPENIRKEEACRKLQAKQAQLSENRKAHVKKEEIIETVQKWRIQEMESFLICTKWFQPAVMLVSYPIKRQLLSQETTYCISWPFCHQNNQKLLSQRHVQYACRIQTSPLNFRLHKHRTFLMTTKQRYCIGRTVSQNIIMVLCFPTQH